MDRKLVVGLVLVAVIVSGGAWAADVTWFASASVEIEAVDGPAITLDEDFYPRAQQPTPDNETVDLGTVAFTSAGDTSANVSSISGSQTTLSNIKASGTTLWANHSIAQRTGVRGVDSITWDDVDLADETSTEISVTGTGTVYVDGFTSNKWVAINRSGELLIEQADASGVRRAD